MPLSLNEIRTRAQQFSREWEGETRETGEYQSFWNDFFDVFGIKRRSVALYQKKVEMLGQHRGFIDLFWPGKLLVEHKTAGKDLDAAFTQASDYFEGLKEEEKPRYVIVTDYRSIRLYDLEGEKGMTQEAFPLKDLPKHVRQFAFIAGYEARVYKDEDPVNIKAVRSVAKLYEALRFNNYPLEAIDKLLTRLVFCFFADDTAIFNQGVFGTYLETVSKEDGSDIGAHLSTIFQVLNTPIDKRQTSADEDLLGLPYVDGELFAEPLPAVFGTSAIRKTLLDCAAFNWSSVSPVIFGSMFQSVMDDKARHDLGAHYTSEKNILKVISGLFLDDLHQELAAAGTNHAKLNALWNKIAAITLLDPACGCGDFLVVAYRELRRLEFEILKRLYRKEVAAGQSALPFDVSRVSKLSVERMYGIEILPFPAEIAQLSLWLVDHLANIELGDYFGAPFAKLPLTEAPHIVKGNALRIDWESVVPKNKLSYILGNPPFLGKKEQSKEQKEDMESVWGDEKGAGVLDYVSCWYKKAAVLIYGTRIAVAFVSTNSITQGEQVGILWPWLLARGVKIHFAHRTFRWSNEAAGKAAVHCIIVGFGEFDVPRKQLFDYADISGEPHRSEALNINPYLVDAPDVVVQSNRKPLRSDVPQASYGSFALDDSIYTFSENERDTLIAQCPKAARFLRDFIGGQELIHNEKRYCLWLADANPEEIGECPEVARRVDAVRQWRLLSNRETTKKLAQTPYLFAEIRQPETDYIAFPTVSSENRSYIPIAILNASVIASNQVYVIPTADKYVFGILTSTMHNTWIRAVCGRLESRYRYSIAIVYNNFPWPEEPTAAQKKVVESAAQGVLDARAQFATATLADLYNPETMPKVLLDAHHALDRAVDKCYGKRTFANEPERLEFLFGLYKEYTEKQTVLEHLVVKKGEGRKRAK
ncbi:MAG: DNA methyltransferase [Patescibacteria group bacterium]